MEVKSEENDKGCPDCNLGALSTESLPENKNIPHPPICMRCKDEYFIFKMPGHPDDGRLLACGIMVENIKAGCMSFACCYFTEVPMTRVDDQVFCTMPGRTCMCNPDTHGACGKIIDSDEANAALLLVEQLKAVH